MKKLNLQGNEIEILAETENSYFDKYLDEVLYLLERIEADGIVFEDIDRFEPSVPVFERLREICKLANIRRGKQKVLRFFYLIRDDSFASGDRTKFFDFILPVIPVVEGSNSFEHLYHYFGGKNTETDGVSPEFLKAISIYIDDMRLIKNIANEFLVYYDSLKEIGINEDKMLAMVIYKNLFPGDFSAFQFREGYLYQIFSDKPSLVRTLSAEIRTEIKKIRDEIEGLRKENAESQKELDFIKEGYQANLPEEEYVNWLRDYERRSETVKNRKEKEDQIKDLEREAEEKEAQLSKLGNSSISELFTIIKKDLRSSFIASQRYLDLPLGKIENQNYAGILRYFLLEGYIDENYSDYCTYFYEGQMSLQDKVYVQAVIEQRDPPSDFRIEHPKAVLECLTPGIIERLGALNDDLFLYLLKNNTDERTLQAMFHYMIANNALEFLCNFYELYPSWNFITTVNGYWPEFLANVMSSIQPKMERSLIIEYSILTIEYAKSNYLVAMNTMNKLTEFICGCDDYLATENYRFEKFREMDRDYGTAGLERFFTENGFSAEGRKRFIHGLKALNVRFCHFQEGADPVLLHDVYVENLYDLNDDIIRLFLHTEYGIPKEEIAAAKEKSELSRLICSKVQEPLCRYWIQKKGLAETESYGISRKSG